MFINILTDGTTQNIDKDNVYQGSNNANTIYVLAPFSTNIQMYMSFEIEATGEIIEPQLMEAPTEISSELNVWKLDVEKILTQYYGAVKYQIKCLSGNQIICTAKGKFQVIEGVDVVLPDVPSKEAYDLILQEIANIKGLFTNGWIEAQGIRPYNSEFTYGLGTYAIGIIDGKERLFKSLIEANKGKELTDITSWQEVANFSTIKDNETNIANLNVRVTSNEQNIGINSSNIESNTAEIEKLKQQSLTGLTYIGTFPSQESLPTENELTQFVFNNTSPNRSPKSGDFIKFTQIIVGETDKNYTVYFGESKWGEFVEDLPVEKASNSAFGLVRGNYGKDLPIEINVVNGDFTNLTTKNLEGTQVDIHTRLNGLDRNQKNIIDGTQSVGLAQKSVGDKNGSDITTTYAQQSEVYTKSQSDERYLPSAYTDVFYYSANGIVTEVPTEPTDQKQFEMSVPSGARVTLFDINRITEEVYNFSKNTTEINEVWVKVDKTAQCQFFLTSKASKDGNEQILANDLTGELLIDGETLKKITFNTTYNGLSGEYKLPIGNIFGKKFEVENKGAETIVVGVYCGVTNQSTTQLSAQNVGYDVNTINGKKNVLILADEWQPTEDGQFSVTIPQTRHEQAPSNQYGLDLQYYKTSNSVQRLVFTPQITDGGDITLTTAQALDCELLIWTSIDIQERSLFELENPTELQSIDFVQYGAVRITQTKEPSNLVLPNPINVAKYYAFFVSNASASTKVLNVNGNKIEIGHGLKFKWNGVEWQLDDMPEKTSEITDDFNNQPLNTTLKDLGTKTMNNFDEINMVAGDLTDLTAEVSKKTNSKSVEMKEGLPGVTNLVEFYKYFYNLRKGNDRTFVVEVDENKNADLMEILGGFPETTNKKGSVLIEIPSTDGVGYPIRNTFISENNTTVYTNYVRGWIISGTSYDGKIHLTSWVNQNDLTNKLSIINEQEKVYATNGLGSQISLQYNVEPYGDGLARRTSDGRLKVTNATESDDAVSKGQLDLTNSNVAEKIEATSYAQSTIGGTLKARFDEASGSLFLTNDGTDA